MAWHLRSASVPSSPLSDGTDVRDQLRCLKADMPSPSITIQLVCGGLTEIVSIYSCIDELTCSTSTSQTQQRKAVEDELEHSIILLDFCSPMQESFVELRTSVQEVQLSLKRVDGLAVHTKVQSYARLARKAQRLCKRISRMADSDMEGCSAIKMTAEARDIAVVILESTLHLLSRQITIPKFSSRWPLVSKAFQKKRFACHERQLQELHIIDLESRLQLLFRRLIHNRVSLLNNLSL